jgi:hypothetical protein
VYDVPDDVRVLAERGVRVHLGEGGSLGGRARDGPQRPLERVHATIQLVHALGDTSELPATNHAEFNELDVVPGYVRLLDHKIGI